MIYLLLPYDENKIVPVLAGKNLTVDPDHYYDETYDTKAVRNDLYSNLEAISRSCHFIGLGHKIDGALTWYTPSGLRTEAHAMSVLRYRMWI